MSREAVEVLRFIGRVRARRMLLQVANHVAIGVVAFVVMALIGRALTRNARGMQAEVILFGVVGAVVFSIVGGIRAWRSRARAADDIERRAPESHNVILTAEELLSAPTRSPSDITDLVVTKAAASTRTLDVARLFPARRSLGMLASALGIWAAAILLTGARDPVAPVTLGRPVPPNEIGTISVVVTPPPYTKRPTQKLNDPSSITAIAGSQIELTVRGNGIRVETVEGSLPCRPEGTEGSACLSRLIATADGFIAIRAGTSDRRLIGLTVTPDQVPRVRVTAPGKDMFIADAARRIPVEIDARDDIALTAIKLRYTKVSGSGERFTFVEGEVPITITRTDDRDWRAKGTLDLGALRLEQGDMVVYRGAAADGRPGGALTESDAFIVEITSPLSIAAEGFSLDDQQDKYALSQQMVILKTERLLARAATMAPESLAYYSSNIAAEQRSVRAEFVFMMGGEVAEDVIAAAGLDLDETKEAEGEAELAAGRMVNRGRVALVEAIRLMSRASTELNNTDPKAALPVEKQALVALQQAFSRTRYLLRALTRRERLDLSRRLTGVLSLAARDALPAPTAPVDPAIVSLRRSLAEIASCHANVTVVLSEAKDPLLTQAGPSRSLPRATSRGSGRPCAQDDRSRIAQEVLAVDPADSTLKQVAARLSESKLDDAATALARALRARLPREDAATEPAELRRLRGALGDAMRGRR